MTIKLINLELDRYSTAIQRPLTGDEATAIAQQYSKMLWTLSLAPISGFVGGNIAAYATRKDFKFPFWSTAPPRRFNPDRFLFLRGGILPRVIWHGLRYGAYTAVGIITASMAFGSYARTVRSVSEEKDPRLTSVRELIRIRIRKNAQMAVDARRKRDQSQMTPESQTSAELWRNHRASIGDIEDSQSQNNEDVMASDQQLTEQEAQSLATLQQRRSSAWSRHQREGQNKSFDPDDASPAAGHFGDDSDQAVEEGGQSAWERIRRRANTSAGSPQPSGSPDVTAAREAWKRNRGTAGREGSTMGDDYAFSNSEEDRQLAKDEAQKSFDERVERERRGGDFGGNEKGGRWS